MTTHTRRRRKRRQDKPDLAKKARWYAARGYPLTFIAQRLGVATNSVRKWCGGNSDRHINRLAVRLKNLSAADFREVMERVQRKLTA